MKNVFVISFAILSSLLYSKLAKAQSTNSQHIYFANDGSLEGKWFKILTLTGGGTWGAAGFSGEVLAFDDVTTAQRMIVLASVHDKQASQRLFHTSNSTALKNLRWIQTASTGTYTGTLELWGQIQHAWLNSGLRFNWKYNNDGLYTITWESGHQAVNSVAPIGNGIYWDFIVGQAIADNGNVGIGMLNPQAKLAVNGDIYSKKVKVTQTGWADYVFEPTYKLPPLTEVEAFIKANKHLPDIPTAHDVAVNGIDLGENQALLFKKIEELTLYVIELKKENDQIKTQLKELMN